MKVAKTESLSVQILKAVGTGLAILFVLSSRSGTHRFLKGIKKEWDRKAAHQTLKRLRKRGLVDFRRREDGALIVKLTKKGKEELRVFESGEIELSRQKWDGCWRVIFFDVPEYQKKAREALRHRFRAWGLYPLQKSVYVSPYPCEEEVMMVRELFHISEDDILIIGTRTLPHQDVIKSHFHL